MRALRLLLLLLAASPAAAQDLDLYHAGVPASIEDHLQRIAGDGSTYRYESSTTILAGRTITGNVVITSGTLTVEGTVRGEIVAVDADVVFRSGAVVEGDITVVRGFVTGEDVAELHGSVTVYDGDPSLWDRAAWTHDDDEDWDRYGRDEDWGHARFDVRVEGNYNRVEGLPVAFGPDIRTGGSMPTRLEALAIWRTDAGPLTNSRPMGYSVRLEQFLGSRALRVGGRLLSVTTPIETWSVTDLEASLAAGLFHEDQRDYFEREGWSAYARFAPRRSPVDLTVEYREEDHASLAPRDPWTLFNGDRGWREQPLVGEGRIRSIGGVAEFDATRGREFARRGWYLRADVRHALDANLVVPAAGEELAFASDFTTALVDLRRYQRAGRSGILALRAIAGGGIDEAPLPPQFQHALGGAGSLPGYSLFSADCGARSAFVTRGDDDAETPRVFYPSFGCDRFALLQAEFRGGFDFRFDPWNDRDWHVDTGLEWTVFFDAGQGWAYSADGSEIDTGMLYDVGAGIVLGGLGIYGAVPLKGDDRDMRFFVRLGPRF